MDTTQALPTAQQAETERNRLIRTTLSTFKSLADAAEGAATPKAVVERIVARGVATGFRMFRPDAPDSLAEKTAAAAAREPIVMAAQAEHKLGPGFVDYEPETLMEALDLDADAVSRMMLVVFALYDPAPYRDWHVFAHLACALNDRPLIFDTPPDLTVAELAWAADALRYIDHSTPFSAEVGAFCAANLVEEGFVTPPEALSFAREALTLANKPGTEGGPVQKERMEAVEAYVTERHARLLMGLSEMRNT